MFLSLYDAFKHLPSERAAFENRCIDLAMNKPIIKVYSFEEIYLVKEVWKFYDQKKNKRE